MSPITMGLLGLLAYKAIKGFSSSTSPATAGAPTSGGGLGDILKNLGAGMGGLRGILSGGLGDLMKQFQDAGKGDIADSCRHRRESAGRPNRSRKGTDARPNRVLDPTHGPLARGAARRLESGSA